jgi:type II restriction/modification system DNA methylase subunit YeeA
VRTLKMLDPACGSGHFLLYAFDLLLAIYEEAHADPASPRSAARAPAKS